MGVGKLHGLRQLTAELVFSNLSENPVATTKLVFSADLDLWVVAGCSLLDAALYVSAV